MRTTRGIIAAVMVAAVLGVVAATAGGTNPPNEGVCPALDTGHLSAGGAASTTITAPAGMLIVEVCVKAGSINQGNGPETTTYDPGVTSVTISHSSGKDISHYSVKYGPGTPPPPHDECPNIPGDQPEGTDCTPDEPPFDQCPNIPGNQPEGTDCDPDEPPFDACPNMPGNQPEGTDCSPTPPPERCPPPNPDGTYGGKDGKPGNDECKADPVPPTTTPTPPTETTTTPPAGGSTTTPPVVSSKPPTKGKPTAKPKPDKPVVIVKVTKKPNGVVVIKTSDGKTHTGIMGSG